MVRRAIRERYLSPAAERKRAMEAVIGMWKDRPEFANPTAYVRKLRKDTRGARLKRAWKS